MKFSRKMWLQGISHSQLRFNLSIGFVVIIVCLILTQTDYVVAQSIKDMKIADQCCVSQMTSSNSSDMNKTVFSFTEEFIAKRTGRIVNLKKLLTNYSLICPIQDTCRVDIDSRFLFPSEIIPDITGCKRCQCERSCVYYGNCCPGAHYGYVGYSCININLYPKNTEESYYMIGTCLDSYNENKTIIELCKEKTEPCTGTESSLIYKNKYCGKCNKELDCISWKIKVECANANEFEDKMKSFSSLIDMKKALDIEKCRIKFQLPNNHLGYPCSDPRKDYLSIVRVDRCNVSDLWETYDEDIEWACENFIIPFQHFKNVFCYICNPSRANMQDVSLIDRCLPAQNNEVSEVNHVCQASPVSNRLAPFKNIYCYVCSQGYNMLFEDNEYHLQYIEEYNNLNLQTQLDIALTFSGVHHLKDFKTFVSNLLDANFEVIQQGTIQNKPRKLNYDASDLIKIVSEYTAVCGAKTLCNVKMYSNNTDKVYGNPVCKTCTCDSVCAENESCCPDILFTREPFSCYNHTMFPVFYKNKTGQLKWANEISFGSFEYDVYKTIDTCLNEDITSGEEQRCSVYDDAQDSLARIPVCTETGITYKNIFCFECNNNKSAITLKFQVICKTYIEHKMFKNIDQLLNAIKLYCEKISFVPLRNKICLNSFDSEKAAVRKGEKFIRRKLHPSQFEFSVKTYEEINATDYGKPVRNVFEKCNTTGLYWNEKSEEITRVCEAEEVNIMLLPEYRIDNNVYKNFACFLCNPEYDLSTMGSYNVSSRCLSNTSVEWYVPDETLADLCEEAESHPRWFPYKNMYCAECNLPPWQLVDVFVLTSMVLPAAGYKYIFSLSPSDFKHLDEVMETEAITDCKSGTYDYSLKECRQLSCNDGFQLFNATCKPVLESAVRHKYSVSFSIHLSAEETLNLSDSNEINMSLTVNFKTLCANVIDNITSLLGETTESIIINKDCKASHCVASGKDNVSKDRTFVDLYRMDKFLVHFTVMIVKTDVISIVHTTLLSALNRQFFISDIQDINGLQKSIVVHSEPSDKNSDPIDLKGCFHFQITGHPTLESLQFNHYTIDAFLTCAHVKLNTSEVYLDLESNNIVLKNMNVSFSVWEYKIVNKNVIICADVYDTRTFIEPDVILVVRTDPIKSVFIVFSFVCTIVSIVCLFLTFITYCFIPSLRTTPGKNIMSLCVSLIFSQGLLQFGINATNITTLCVAIGISVHLFWLVSFCAMNICSFHTFKVFHYNRPATNLSDISVFFKYLIYMICLPIVMVLATICASLIKSDASDIGYGHYYCFISDFYIFIFTFITPACLLFASNIVFFSMAFYKIRSAPNVQGTRDRNHFYICLRLCTIVGIAWPLIIIDSSLGITWFSFVAAGVNALQGVFIFVSFVLNRRIALIFVSTILEKLGEQTISTITHGTESSPRNYRVKTAETI